MSFFTIIFPLDSGRPLENETKHLFPAYRHCDELLNSMLLVLAMEAVYARANDDANTACRFSSTTLFRASNTNDPPNQPLSVALFHCCDGRASC